jgi:hypothetical protein
MSTEEITRPYVRLESLRSNLPEHRTVGERYVDEFHQILDSLEKASGQSLDEFRVPLNEKSTRRLPSRYRGTGSPLKVTYSTVSRYERSFLLMKIEGVLRLFQLQTCDQDSRIGFRP